MLPRHHGGRPPLLPLVVPAQTRSALRHRWLRHSICEIRGPDDYSQALRRHFVNYKLHRDDGPAIEYGNGRKEYYRGGLRHREDGPAIECADGHKQYYHAGHLHRDDGPAVEDAGGHKEYFRAGLRHRTDGPAVEGADGHKEYYRDGRLHRDDGPAIERPDGRKQYYRDGILLCVLPSRAEKRACLDKVELASFSRHASWCRRVLSPFPALLPRETATRTIWIATVRERRRDSSRSQS